jgi:hypothetical protein
MVRRVSMIFLLACGAALPAPAGAETSPLWGGTGEKWDPKGRLPDFSYAGYRMGEAPIPETPARASVKDFGAKGDGKTDDTKAFQDALEKTREGALLVPPGKFVITDFLTIARSGVVLRGAGPEKTTLFFPRYLNDIKADWGATTTGKKTSNYSWQGGFIQITGGGGRGRIAGVAEKAERGGRTVVLDKAAGIRAGDLVDLRQEESGDNALAKYLYNNQPGPLEKLLNRARTSLVTRVAAVEGARLTVERPLRTDLSPEFKAAVFGFEPSVTDSGVEAMAFEFPPDDYPGEFSELGHNPVVINATHCWIRDVKVINGDSGPYINGKFNTVQRVVFEATRKVDRTGCIGHHGITCYGDDNLVEDFDFRCKYVHDLTVEHSAGNVFHRGKGVDMCFDHHKKAPHANLFTDLDLGDGRRMYRSGGGDALGKHCAAWGTFWNLRAQNPVKYPSEAFGPDLMNFVGVFSSEKPILDKAGKWWEPIPPAQLVPQDLYEAQVTRRLKRPPDRGRPSPAAAEKPARPAAAPETARLQATPAALAAWEGRLKVRLREALQAGRKPRFPFAAMGGVVQATELDAGDQLKTSGGGVAAQVPWGALSLADRLALSAALAESNVPEDIAVAAFYALAAGDAAKADDLLKRLPDAVSSEIKSSFR